MAVRIECGPAEANERAALDHLARVLGPQWCLLTSIPRHVTGERAKGREIDALALSPRGAIVIELKHVGGDIAVSPLGEWLIGGEAVTDPRGRVIYPLQQAGKAAQALKSVLGEGARGAYIDACAIATGAGARVSFVDPGRPAAVGGLQDAAQLIERLASASRGIPASVMYEVFRLIGKPVPDEAERAWRSAPAPAPAPVKAQVKAPRPASGAASGSAARPPASRPSTQRPQPPKSRPEPAPDRKSEGGGLVIGLVIVAVVIGAAYFIFDAMGRRAPALPAANPEPSAAPPGPAEKKAAPATATAPSAPATPSAQVVVLGEANASDIWSTSVYSYAEGGGGPGGGLANEYLRVGGWGDEYVSLIRFDLPPGPCRGRAVLKLYSEADEAGGTPMRLLRITRPWSWARGDRLWWRDLPPAESWSSLPAPEVGRWMSIDISDLYARWCSGELPNNGLMLRPVRNDHVFNRFVSTRGESRRRPRLVLSDD